MAEPALLLRLRNFSEGRPRDIAGHLPLYRTKDALITGRWEPRLIFLIRKDKVRADPSGPGLSCYELKLLANILHSSHVVK